MSNHKGKLSGTKRSEGTGVPSTIDENSKRDQRLTNEYTNEDEKVADSVRTNNPNRNMDKGDATNIHGYRG